MAGNLQKNPFAVAPGEPRAPVIMTLYALQIHRSDLTPVKALGKGEFGDVYLAKQKIKSRDGKVSLNLAEGIVLIQDII